MSKLVKAILPSLIALLALGPQAGSAAGNTGGVSGYVVDGATNQPLKSAIVAIYRMPASKNSEVGQAAMTDKHGFFVNLSLQPGRYLVTANVAGRTADCVVDDVFDGQVRHMKIIVGGSMKAAKCIGPRIHSAAIDPDATADVYRIR